MATYPCPHCGALLHSENHDAVCPICGRPLGMTPAPESPSGDGYWSFHSMISPVLIKVIFVLGFLAITGFGIYYPFSVGFTAISAFAGFCILVVGNVLWRVLCEGWIIFFRIHETLVAQQHTLEAMERKMNRETAER